MRKNKYLPTFLKRVRYIKFLDFCILVSLLLSIIVVVKYSLTAPYSPDSWTHIGVGKYIIELKKIPTHSNLSFKEELSPSLEWLSHSWASDTLFYLGAITGGFFTGLIILLPVFALSAFLLYKILIILQVSKRLSLALLPIPIVMLISFWKIHPLSIALILTLLIYLIYLLWRNNKSFFIFFWPVIILAFANAAGGFLFIPLLFLFFITITEIVYRILNRYFTHKSPQIGKLLILIASLIISFFAAAVNPYNARLYIYPLTFFGILEKKSWISSLSGSLLITNQNFLRNSPSTFAEALYVFYFVVSAALLFYTLIKKRNFLVKHYYIIPLILFFILPLLWVRFIPLAAFMTFPIFALLLSEIFTSTKKIIISILILIIVCISGYLIIKPIDVLFSEPKQHISIIKKLDLPLNIFTSQDITGYTLYSLFPSKMGLDAQDDIFDDNELITTFSSSTSMQNSPEIIDGILEENNIGTILVSKNIGDMAYLFNQIDNWALIYFDDNGFLFSKKDFLDEKFLNEHEIKHLELDRNLGFDPKYANESARELERFTKKYPDNYLALGQLASIYRFQEKLDLAEKTLLKIPDNNWSYITKTEMARLRAAQGYCKSSEKWFLEALNDRNEKNFSRAVLDLAVLYATCLNDPEKARHYLSRYHSFQLSPLEREKVRQISDDFNIPLEE